MRKDILKIANTYRLMVDRCTSNKRAAWKDYGGRGIYVCDGWLFNPTEFFDWIDSVCSDTTGLQIDRIDNNGPYSPENCRWVTPTVNGRNRRTSKMLTALGETKSMGEWSEDTRCEVTYQALSNRLLNGWSIEESILTKPNASRAGKVPTNSSVFTAFGESKSSSEWMCDARCVMTDHKVLWARIENGWSHEDAISKPAAANVTGLVYDGHNILYWSKQPECEVSYNTLSRRLKAGEPLAESMKQQTHPRGIHKNNNVAPESQL